MTILNQQTLQKYLPQLMLQQIMCSGIETLINKALQLNNNHSVNQQLALLEQKTLAVKLTELPFPLCFSINQKKVLVTKLIERADCTIITSLQTLKAIQQKQQITTLIKQDKLDVEGDIKVAQQCAHIAESIDIDWQTELAKNIGDVSTHKITTLGKNLIKKFTFARDQIQADASEYLIHEKKLIVSNSEIQTFNLQVINISNKVNDISSRIDALTKHLSNK